MTTLEKKRIGNGTELQDEPKEIISLFTVMAVVSIMMAVGVIIAILGQSSTGIPMNLYPMH